MNTPIESNGHDYSYSTVIFTNKCHTNYHQCFYLVPLLSSAWLHKDFYMKTNCNFIKKFLQSSVVQCLFLGCSSLQPNAVQCSNFNGHDYSHSIVVFTVKYCSNYHKSIFYSPITIFSVVLYRLLHDNQLHLYRVICTIISCILAVP